MPHSLFIEHHSQGLSFYINGDLQFDTADEFWYHEYLVIPTISLAVQRFPNTELRVLICGGGDGLAAREALRFPQVSQIHLVDYNPEVLDLGKTVFKPYNQGSLDSDRVTIYSQDAFQFIADVAENFYHVIICDFTYPTSPEDTTIYTREWFQQIDRVLISGGTFATNGVSPETRSMGFWCLYQTILSANLKVKPLHLEIPSFCHHDYGVWGFLFGSTVVISRESITTLNLPENLRILTLEKLLQSFIFTDQLARIRYEPLIHTINSNLLFYYLLNPTQNGSPIAETDRTIDFLDFDESCHSHFSAENPIQLESIAELWLKQLDRSPNSAETIPDLDRFIPVQHRYHSPKMTREWLTHLGNLLSEIDLSRLIHQLLERSSEIPPKMARDLKQLSQQLRSGQILSELPPSTAEFITILSVTLLMSNLLTPDAVFAKGFSTVDRHSGGGYTGSYRDGADVTYYYENDYNPHLCSKILGLIFTSIGIVGLLYIYKNSNQSNRE
jgi:spermidine synthase